MEVGSLGAFGWPEELGQGFGEVVEVEDWEAEVRAPGAVVPEEFGGGHAFVV